MDENDPGPDPGPERKRRVSITKLQRQTIAGAELIALCQTITEDGSLAREEVEALQQWLDDNHDSDLPAIDFLRQTVQRIVADGKVTAEERQELYEAIETVLPPDIRGVVRDRRREVEAAEKARQKAERAAARDAAEEEKARTRALDSWDFMVAGVLYEGRARIVADHANAGDPAFLARDRANAYSRHAVEVRLGNGMQIGYVPEEFAVEVAPLLDAGHPHTAYLKKILTGGRAPYPVVVASVYRTDAIRAGLVFEHQVPAKVATGAAVTPASTTAPTPRAVPRPTDGAAHRIASAQPAQSRLGCMLAAAIVLTVVASAACAAFLL
jgi:hypothetical protein